MAALWLGAVGAGLRVLYEYENRPGPSAGVISAWPAASRVRLNPSGPTIIMFAHPWCPCSRASMGELESIMARVQGQVSAYVLFAKPQDSSEEWEKTSLWRNAAAIPRVTVLGDPGGHEAIRFGGQVSGHVLLFDSRGRLLFSGGITGARGHSGDNAGRRAILALVAGQEPARAQTPVFGCHLHDPDAAALRAEPAWEKRKAR